MIRRALPLLVLIACNSGDKDTDTAESDTDTDADTDSDTDTDTDTDSDTDTDVEAFCHEWEPVASDGWVRRYDVEFAGTSGEEVWAGKGSGISDQSFVGYEVEISSTAGQGDYFRYYGCDLNNLGLYLAQWEGSYFDALPWPLPDPHVAVLVDYSTPRRLMPDVLDVGNESTWTYDHQLTFKAGQEVFEIPVTGTVEDKGIGHSITVPAGTYDNAYLVEDTYTEDRTSLTTLGMGGITIAKRSTWFVKGIGMVKQEVVHETDSDGSGTLASRELTQVSGLTEQP